MALPQAGLHLVLQGAAAFKSDLASAGHGVSSFINSLEKGVGTFNIFRGASERLGRELTILGRVLAYTAFYGALRATQDLTASVFQQVAAYELLEASLQSMTARDLVRAGTFKTVTEALEASGPVARELITWMEKLDIASRFDLATIQNLYTLGSTYGFIREQMQPLTGIMLDWASATGRGAGDILGAMRALGQIYQKQKFLLLESNQLAEHGVPAVEYLARAYGTTTDEIREMISDGLIPANKALQIITDGMAKDYAGATARFAQTVTGLTTSLVDLIRIDLREFGLGIAEGVLPYVAALVDWLQSPGIREGFRSLGQSIGESIGNFFAWGAAILSTEDPLRTLAYVIDDALPGFGHLFDVLVRVGPKFLELAAAAFEWGVNIGSALAAGLLAAAEEVLYALEYLAGLLTYWLAPGSPPRILPDLEVWGQEWITTLIQGFAGADISALSELGGVFRTAFENLVPAGQLDVTGIIPALLGSQDAIGQAIRDMQTFGAISGDTLNAIRTAAGPAADTLIEVVQSYTAWTKASEDLAQAQSDLTQLTSEYDAKLGPLKSKLESLASAEKTAEEEKDLAKWRKIAASDAYSAASRAKAQREIEKIELARQIRQLELQKDAAVEVGQAKVDAAQTAVDAAKTEYETQKARIDFQHKQNELVQEQVDLLKRLENQATAAAEVIANAADKAGAAEKKAAEDAAEAEFKLALAKADTTGKIELYKQKLAELEPGTKEYFDTQREIVGLEQQLAREQERAGEAAERAMEKEARAAEQLRDAQFEAELAGKSHTERLKLLQDRLAELTPGTKEYYEMLKRVRQEQEAVNREAEAAAKKAAGGKGKGEGVGGGGGAPYKPEWGGLDLSRIGELSEKAKAKIEEFRLKMAELGHTVTVVKGQLSPYKEIFEGIAIAVGITLVGALIALTASVLQAAAPFLAVAGAVTFLKFAWDTNLGGMRDKLIEVWDKDIKPALDLLGQALSMWLPDDVKSLSDAWNKVLLPALMKVWQFIVDFVIPFLGVLASTLIVVVAGAIAGLKVVIFNVLIPAFNAIWDWVKNKLIPWFEAWVEFFNDDVPRAWDKFKRDTNQYVIQPIKDAWQWVKDIQDTMEKWALYAGVTIALSFSAFKRYVVENIFTPVKDAWQKVKDARDTMDEWGKFLIVTLGLALTKFKNDYINPVTDAIDDIWTAIDDVLKIAKTFVDYLSTITIPTLSLDIDWPEPPSWFCDAFGCSPKPPPQHATVFIDPVYTTPKYARNEYSTPMTPLQASTVGQSVMNNTVMNNYNYSPTYGGGPRNEPRRNFDIMRTWGL